MRPKKKILLIDSDETRCSIRSFVLSNRGFLVFPVANAGDALRAAVIVYPDLAVLRWPFEGASALLDELHKRCPLMRSMVIGEELTEAPTVFADVILLEGQCSQEKINELAKVLCARRHGPRKGAAREMPPVIQRAVEFLDMAQRRIA
jgi:CheY-like chemotaxis protein